jgi:hypothetical protein
MKKMKRRIEIAVRMREIRQDLYGEHGLENLAVALGVPAQTWRNYEQGITMPAEMLLEFMVLTGADPTGCSLVMGNALVRRFLPLDWGGSAIKK